MWTFSILWPRLPDRVRALNVTAAGRNATMEIPCRPRNSAGPLIVGISGASGAIYGIRMLEALRDAGVESHLVISQAGQRTMAEEAGLGIKEVRALATHWHPVQDIGASIASGSIRTRGMVIAPCSIRTAAEIASGTTMSLLTRAADVVLKERRRLVLMLRETPLHTGHLRMLTHLSEVGAIVAPPVPAFYDRPKSLDAMINHTIGRILDLFEIDNDLAHRWRSGDA